MSIISISGVRHCSTEQVEAELAAIAADETGALVLSSQAAGAIASWWHSPASALASLSTGFPRERSDIADAVETELGMLAKDDPDRAELIALLDWVNKYEQVQDGKVVTAQDVRAAAETLQALNIARRYSSETYWNSAMLFQTANEMEADQ